MADQAKSKSPCLILGLFDSNVYVVSLDYVILSNVILSKVVPCPLPSCFNSIFIKVQPLYIRSGIVVHGS